jgi:hypothetical protein
MMVETESGEMAITSGKQVTMTLTDPAKSVAATGGEEGLSTNTKYALGAIAGAIVITGGILLASDSGGGGGGGGGGSPAAP